MIEPIASELTDWAALETPCYVFDEPELRANFADFGAALEQAWSPLAKAAYSVKTNPFPWILDVAREEGALAEVVSADEFALALDCGFTADQVVFNGPIKPKDWLFYALDHASIVNLDSERELAWACEYARERGQAQVGIRVNIDLDHFCPGETITGPTGGRFGFCYENGELSRAIARLRGAGAAIAGLHMHVTTLSRSQRAYRVLAQHAARIVEEEGIQPSWIDMGGGFYGGGMRNDGAYERYAETIAHELRNAVDPLRCALYVEPGGAVVCTPGRYVGKAVDAKDMAKGRFVTCELSRVNIDHEMKKTSYPLHVLPGDPAPRKTLEAQTLCGFTCMESDRLCVLRDRDELLPGDTLIIDFAGAYSMSFTPGFFIQHAPAVYARDERGACRLLRPLASPSAPTDGLGS